MTLHSISRRGRVTDVKVKSSNAYGTEIVVALAFRRSLLSDAERAALVDYHGFNVDARLSVVGPEEEDDDATPMDRELERVNGHRPERMRPLPHNTCSHCGKLIGEDPDAGFYVPPLGQPLPCHGDCLAEIQPPEDEPGTVTDEQLETLLALVDLGPRVPVSEWTAEEREQAAEWAAREHVHASDHDDVERLERPAFLDSKTVELPPRSPEEHQGRIDAAAPLVTQVVDAILGPERPAPRRPVRILPGGGER